MSAPRQLRRGDRGWPDRLEHLPDPPASLWLRGSAAPCRPAVAIVGSRRATLTGLDVARSLAAELAEAGVQVISGFARGVDSAAHRGALEGRGSTLAVLGCGIDVPYPRGSEALREAVVASGLLLTEHAAGVAPEAWHFPRRNRIIAALADAVVVVEASERSGALSTARWAADLGREVLAVPGSIRCDRSVGTNRLIRDGARPLLVTADLLDALGLDRPPAALTGGARAPLGALPAELGELLGCLGTNPSHPDLIAAALELPAAVVAARLSVLEVLGAVRTLPGGLVASRPAQD